MISFFPPRYTRLLRSFILHHEGRPPRSLQAKSSLPRRSEEVEERRRRHDVSKKPVSVVQSLLPALKGSVKPSLTDTLLGRWIIIIINLFNFIFISYLTSNRVWGSSLITPNPSSQKKDNFLGGYQILEEPLHHIIFFSLLLKIEGFSGE